MNQDQRDNSLHKQDAETEQWTYCLWNHVEIYCVPSSIYDSALPKVDTEVGCSQGRTGPMTSFLFWGMMRSGSAAAMLFVLNESICKCTSMYAWMYYLLSPQDFSQFFPGESGHCLLGIQQHKHGDCVWLTTSHLVQQKLTVTIDSVIRWFCLASWSYESLLCHDASYILPWTSRVLTGRQVQWVLFSHKNGTGPPWTCSQLACGSNDHSDDSFGRYWASGSRSPVSWLPGLVTSLPLFDTSRSWCWIA